MFTNTKELIHACEIKLGTCKGQPRIWTESRVRLEDAGFLSGATFEVKISEDEFELVLSESGKRKVSQKIKGDQEHPVIDVNTSALFDVFDESLIGKKIYARFYKGRIVFTPLPLDEAIQQREDKFFSQLESGNPVDIVSLFTGSGFLDMAFKEGMAESGIPTQTVFANELDDRFLSNGLENNPALRGARSVQGSISALHRHAIPQSSVLIAGLPCVGFSKSGKSKNGISSELQHNKAGHLFLYLVNQILNINPALILIENVPEAEDSVTFSLIEQVLHDNGYNIQKTIINSRDHGALEERKRLCFVATSRNIEFDISLFQAPGQGDLTVGDIMDDEVPESAWSTMQYLKDKEKRDKAAGKGFSMHIVTPESDRVSTLGAGYAKVRSTETKVAHPTDPGLLRQFTKSEHARIKGYDPEMVSELSGTVAHMVLGNGIVKHGFKSFSSNMAEQFIRNKVQAEEPVQFTPPKCPSDSVQLSLL